MFTHAAETQVSIDWVNASHSFLQQIYTKHDYCVLTNPDPLTNCKKKVSNHVENKCSALTKQDRIRQLSHVFPQSMYHLPKEYAKNNESALSLTKLTDMFIALNRTNRVLMLIGDSITRNSLEALECLLSIEQRSGIVNIAPSVGKVLWGANRYTISLANAHTLFEMVSVSILYFAVWTPYGNGAGELYLKEAQRLMKHDNPATGIVFVFNIGMHEKHEPTQTKHVSDMLSFAQKKIIPMTSRRNLFLYRESSAQHYNSTAGYFNAKQSLAWKAKKLPLPTCVPYNTVENDVNDWRYNGEQEAFKIKQFDKNNVIPFRQLSRHYFDVHSSSPYFKTAHQKSGPDRDCTHFSLLAAPVLYRVLWYQILQRALHGFEPLSSLGANSSSHNDYTTASASFRLI